jgi:hypothetical protein
VPLLHGCSGSSSIAQTNVPPGSVARKASVASPDCVKAGGPEVKKVRRRPV